MGSSCRGTPVDLFPGLYIPRSASVGQGHLRCHKDEEIRQFGLYLPKRLPVRLIFLSSSWNARILWNYFKNSHILNAQLQNEQNKANVRKLVRTAPTRWGTIKGCCETLLSSERVLHAIGTARNFIRETAAQKTKCTRIKEVVTSEKFVHLQKKSLRILAPINTLIVKYQSDAILVS